MSQRSFKVFSFDGLRGLGDCSGREQTAAGWFRPAGFTNDGDPDKYRCPPGYEKIGLRCAGPCGGYWCAPINRGNAGLRGFGKGESSGELTGTLAGGSVIRIAAASTARLVWTPPGEAPIYLLVNRSILARLVVTTAVHGMAAPPGGGTAVVRTDVDTTVALREPVRLERDPAVSEASGIFENLGNDVQLVLPANAGLEVLEAADESTPWLQPVSSDVPPPPPPPAATKKRFPWLPVLGGVLLLGATGWLIFGGKKKES